MTRNLLIIILGFLFHLNHCTGAEPAKIAVVKSREMEVYCRALEGFREEMDSSGIEYERVDFQLKDSELGTKIARGNFDLVLAIGTTAASKLSRAVKQAPILFTMVLDPWGSGLKADNLYGIPKFVVIPKI